MNQHPAKKLGTILSLSLLFCANLAWSQVSGDGLRACKRKSVQYGYVCVCDESYCDAVPQVYPSSADAAIQIETANDGTFMQVKKINWNISGDNAVHGGKVNIRISPGNKSQELVGFGGAFTDTTGANLAKLPTALADMLLRQYFDSDGIRYTMVRIPMASVDMSVRIYSYDDTDGDFNLTNFNLTREDFEWKIPHIKQAAALVNSWAGNASWMAGRKYPLLLYGSPWSAPWWMKSTKRMQGPGVLIGGPSGPYWNTFADYFVKFLSQYKSNGLPLWGVTVGNEPTAGFVPGYPWQAMGMTAYMTRDFVKNNLGPKLHQNGFEEVKIMVLDDQRFMVGSWADRIYTDPEASKYIAGMGVHWYWDSFIPPSGLSSVHEKYPDKFILATEACNGVASGPGASQGVNLGNWDRAEAFVHDIIEDLNHWVIGWVEWSLCVNQTGGPTWTENVLDAPIVVNADQKEFYKQPMFYALAHFGAYIPPTSHVIRSVRVSWETVDIKDVEVLSVLRPDQKRVVVILNKYLLIGERNSMVFVNLFTYRPIGEGTSLSWDPALADGNKPCSKKSVKYGFVCVCNEKYCDSVPQEYPSGTDGAIQVESASDGTFMRVKQLQWNFTYENKMQHDDIAGRVTLKILSGIRYQELVGFGGAFTDTTGANLGSIPAGLADLILRQYFEDDGARYTMARIPMASVDMSVRVYSYDDVDGDFNMTKFNLTKEDFDWKIPHVKRAAALVNSWAGNASWMAGRKYPLLLYGSPWSAPWWMKSTKRMQGPGVLIGGPSGPYWEAFAEYFVKFLANYKAEGVPLWGVTVTNEPTGAFAPGFPWQAMGMTAYMTRDFVKHNLGPKMHENGFKDVKIMVLDDQRFMVGSWADRIYTDPDASKYVSGMAMHWYWDSFTPPSGLSSVHKKYPDKFILASEACNGESVGTLMSKGVKLGDWQRAENFAHDIIQDLNHWVIGWVEWNLCLNQTGGPTWTENLLDSPIIVNADQKEFYKQPTFYALAHFSAYIPPTSQVIHSKYVSWETVDIKDVDVLSVVRPDQKRVVVILNKLV